MPVAFFLDVDIVRLNFRKKMFQRKLLLRKKTFPLLIGSDYLLSRFMYLSPEDLDRLRAILKMNIEKETSFSGHILFNGEKEVPFPARLFTSNIAVVEIFNYLTSNEIDITGFRQEIDALIKSYSRLFGKNSRYSYCYR